MKQLQQFTAIIESEDDGSVSLCPELDIASQGDTVEEARRNLAEAVGLFFEAADPSEVQSRLPISDVQQRELERRLRFVCRVQKRLDVAVVNHPRKCRPVHTFLHTLLLCSLLCGQSWATAIVLVRTAKEIVIAADSRATAFIRRKERIEPEFSSVCKIGGTGNFYFAVSGHAIDLSQPANLYNSYAVGERFAFREKGSLPEKVNGFEEAIRKTLTGNLTAMRQNNRWQFDGWSNQPSVVDIVLFGIEKKVATVYRLTFAIVPNTSQLREEPIKLKVNREVCGKGCELALFVVEMGEYAAIDRLLTATPDYWQGNLIAKVQELIELEIKDAIVVGPPIDIFRLTTKGPEWIQQKQQCKQ
jgi:predicted RNase H-like HicB family nuclease